MSLSPYVKKPFNSKVIKSFVPELRSRKCFCVSGFLCYLYMSYEHSMYVSHIHIMGMLHFPNYWLIVGFFILGIGTNLREGKL